ncbi:condensation domain-containing protein [Streptomyces sp. ME02-6979.5a]|uniref:condensation domain-containing protein n=1 Tax=Streptomyces sp. ME02-6979.5a TaxID=462925 RepID=UPI0029A65B1B|nr:condensation domain-containing protein [Streptomyces sp. ME02-6979.5a]MDX3339685.1 condensation domain-containing protein [Streptomyces sp. ME02-6979.5a]
MINIREGGEDRDFMTAHALIEYGRELAQCVRCFPSFRSDMSRTFPLTEGQYNHWSALRNHPIGRNPVYIQHRISGELNIPQFITALKGCVTDHEALRVGITLGSDGRPVQWVREVPEGKDLIDCRQVASKDEGQFSHYARNVLMADLQKDWHLAEELPFQFRLLRHSESVHAFLATFSHLAVDGTGRALFARDLWQRYRELEVGNDLAAGVPVSFESVVQERLRASRERSDSSRDSFWESRAAAAPPTFQAFEGVGSSDGAQSCVLKRLNWREAALAALRDRSRAAGVTEFQWILAAFVATLFEFTEQDLVKLTIPVDTRRWAERGVVGMFMVPLPVVLERPTEPGGLVRQVKRELLAVIAHRDLSVETFAAIRQVSRERWGAHRACGISINHLGGRQVEEDMRTPSVLVQTGPYWPDFAYETDGVSLQVRCDQDETALRLVFLESLFSDAGSEKFLEILRTRTYDVDIFQSKKDEEGNSTPCEDGRKRESLKDSLGRSVVSVDVAEIAAGLATIPGVAAADVEVENHRDGGTALRATARAAVGTDIDDLYARLRAAEPDTPGLVIPGNVVVVRAIA